ncbi:hypothetical protein SLEP1_g39356 [Rubroshorea leprosula]|uniref:Uncharacterized protein n=1 Tax=Rubroshorea leprosula TaxID=152421 RepID=A0AAV5L0K3_9ROSI|nr:hypothetical protein SLEP1_g39356 [Rubroshorea leprosula]
MELDLSTSPRNPTGTSLSMIVSIISSSRSRATSMLRMLRSFLRPGKCWKLLSLPMRSLCYDGDGAISRGG